MATYSWEDIVVFFLVSGQVFLGEVQEYGYYPAEHPNTYSTDHCLSSSRDRPVRLSNSFHAPPRDSLKN